MDLIELYKKCEDQLNLEMKRIYDENAKTPFRYRMSKGEAEHCKQLLIDKVIFSKIKNAIFDEFVKDAARGYELLTLGGDWMVFEWDRHLDEVVADKKMRTFPELKKIVRDMKSNDDFRGITTYFVHQFSAYFKNFRFHFRFLDKEEQ